MSILSNPRSAAGPDLTDDPRWSAVLARDPAADGRFVLGVLTTGIYCRPSCPARKPRPENVRLFDTPAEAEHAGFRACLRCRPAGAAPAADRAALVTRACRTIEASDPSPTLDELASEAGLSPFHFHRLFKGVTGVTPRAYAAAHRAQRLRTALDEPDASVTEAGYAAGFGSSGRLYAATDGVLGMTPRAYRAGGERQRIRFAVAPCRLGFVLVAATARGLCAITLGDAPSSLVDDLKRRFPKADLVEADAGFTGSVEAVTALIETPARGLDLPLDIAGTAFQRQVWEALRAIPAGETATYADIAGRIGQPRAVRAVAQACASNALAVAVPCHRVVRSDGGLSGYRWGVERKRDLLAREARWATLAPVLPCRREPAGRLPIAGEENRSMAQADQQDPTPQDGQPRPQPEDVRPDAAQAPPGTDKNRAAESPTEPGISAENQPT
jgi:AraC family transcriptional regulator, regulatory protein of adaptative response / methylated-DNA-[protein]-cysteine methyltransferase